MMKLNWNWIESGGFFFFFLVNWFSVEAKGKMDKNLFDTRDNEQSVVST